MGHSSIRQFDIGQSDIDFQSIEIGNTYFFEKLNIKQILKKTYELI